MKRESDYAKKYKELGLNILPASFKKKNPNLKSWTQYQDKKPDNDTFNEWIKRGRFFNINLVLGHTSEVAEIDVDVKNVPVGLLVTGYESNEVWVCESSEGKVKIFFKPLNEDYKRKLDTVVNSKGGHVEFRGNGYLSVLPPSTHPTGCEYKWLNAGINTLEPLTPIDGNMLYERITSMLKEYFKYREKREEEAVSFDNSGGGVRDLFWRSMQRGDSWSGSSGHYFRLAFCAELINNGYNDEQIHTFFKTHDKKSGEDYSRQITQKKINELRKKGMNCWTNKKIKQCCPDMVS